MSEPATRPWWADVQHLREPAERRLRLAEPAGNSEVSQPEDRALGPGASPAAATAAAEPGASLAAATGAADPAAARPASPEPDLAGRGADLRLVAPVPPAPASAEWVAPERPTGRRTVVIRGQAIPNVSARPLIEVQRRRPPRRPAERTPGRPDRIALWAVLLGLLLIAVALSTAHP